MSCRDFPSLYTLVTFMTALSAERFFPFFVKVSGICSGLIAGSARAASGSMVKSTDKRRMHGNVQPQLVEACV
jgi:xanthine/uracil permease